MIQLAKLDRNAIQTKALLGILIQLLAEKCNFEYFNRIKGYFQISNEYVEQNLIF